MDRKIFYVNSNRKMFIVLFVGETDMFADSMKVHEARASKVNQLRLATQVVKMLLKIDDIIAPQEVFAGM